MRWKIDTSIPKLGDKRNRTAFAWLPTIVEDYKVWLESYEIVEEYKEVDSFDDFVDEPIKIQRWVEIERRLVVYFP